MKEERKAPRDDRAGYEARIDGDAYASILLPERQPLVCRVRRLHARGGRGKGLVDAERARRAEPNEKLAGARPDDERFGSELALRQIRGMQYDTTV